jgi:glutaminase
MIKPELNIADRFEYVQGIWKSMSGESHIGFNNSVYLSERQTADRNFALGYFMRENNAFPKNTNLQEILEFYFQCCSLEINTKAMAIIASTLANGGVCPLTGKTVFSSATVKHCLSLMYSCGMYDFSGEYSFSIGLPSKSGVSGVVITVIPNMMGMCSWSPRLDSLGNSVRGIEFFKELVNTYSFHNFDSLVREQSNKKDPRRNSTQVEYHNIVDLAWAAARGDLKQIQSLVARGIDLNIADYDGRTALHLAASEGQKAVVEYLIIKKVKLNPKDRWGGTPLKDAQNNGHKDIIRLIEKSASSNKIQ